jgi:hypothetical protein
LSRKAGPSPRSGRVMKIRSVNIGWLLALLLSGACSRTAAVETLPDPVAWGFGGEGDTSFVVNRTSISPRDTSLFAAVALSIADSAGGYEVRVDPRRLPAEFDAPEALPSRGDMGATPDKSVEKVASIVDAGMREPDRRRMAAACGGRSPCPERTFLQVVIGTPRLGVPKLPPVMAPLTVKATYWTVRVVSTSMNPGSSSTKVSDHVFDKTPTGWVLVRRITLFDFH